MLGQFLLFQNFLEFFRIFQNFLEKWQRCANKKSIDFRCFVNFIFRFSHIFHKNPSDTRTWDVHTANRGTQFFFMQICCFFFSNNHLNNHPICFLKKLKFTHINTRKKNKSFCCKFSFLNFFVVCRDTSFVCA